LSPPKFFVEFTFSYELTGRTYWLPLFLAAADPAAANATTQVTKKALEEHYKDVFHSTPIPELEFTKNYIMHKFDIHRSYKMAILNVDVWQFEEVQPELSFNENLNFIAYNRPLSVRNIAQRIEAHRFPVRVVREGRFPVNFKEFLLINVVATN